MELPTEKEYGFAQKIVVSAFMTYLVVITNNLEVNNGVFFIFSYIFSLAVLLQVYVISPFIKKALFESSKKNSDSFIKELGWIILGKIYFCSDIHKEEMWKKYFPFIDFLCIVGLLVSLHLMSYLGLKDFMYLYLLVPSSVISIYSCRKILKNL